MTIADWGRYFGSRSPCSKVSHEASLVEYAEAKQRTQVSVVISAHLPVETPGCSSMYLHVVDAELAGGHCCRSTVSSGIRRHGSPRLVA
jgi:hypothetical protein